MKRLLVLFSVVLTLLLVGCNANQQSQETDKGDFKFYSLEWGADWETVQKNENLQNVEYEVTESGQRQTVTLEGLEYLDVKLDKVGLAFDTDEMAETNRLHMVVLQFAEENEEILLNKLTELYGERKSAYIDKNGAENPINPAGWISSDTVENVLTKKEKEYFLSMLPKEYKQTRIDALLRSPLVSIKFDEEHNLIEFQGNTASVVAFVKAEVKKQ